MNEIQQMTAEDVNLCFQDATHLQQIQVRRLAAAASTREDIIYIYISIVLYINCHYISFFFSFFFFGFFTRAMRFCVLYKLLCTLFSNNASLTALSKKNFASKSSFREEKNYKSNPH